MTDVINKFAAFCDERGIKYTISGDREEVMVIHQQMPGTNVIITAVLTSEIAGDPKQMQIRIYNLCKFPAVTPEVMKEINYSNAFYRWYSFFVTDQSDLVLSADVIFAPDDPVDTIFTVFVSGLKICEDIYPKLMKLVWGDKGK